MRRETSTRDGGGGQDAACFAQESAGLLRIFERCWSDPDFKRSFIANPIQVLEAGGIQTPPGVRVVVVENDPNVIHIVLPSQSTEAPEAPPIDGLASAPLQRRHEVGGWL
jgi:hypothetical protein